MNPATFADVVDAAEAQPAPVLALNAGRTAIAVATPADLLRIAVENGADFDLLEKLMQLQEHWERIAIETYNSSPNTGMKEFRKACRSARPGGSHLLADALADRFDVLVAEGLDRILARSGRAGTHRPETRAPPDGYDRQMGSRKIMRGVRGMINELYLDDLRHKTHCGQSGQLERGFIAGGACYGYDIVRTEAGSRYIINDEEANWVRWMFRKFATDG